MKQVIYVSNSDKNKIYIWELFTKGQLNLLQILKIDIKIHPLVVHPNKKFLYGGGRPDDKGIIFKINENGTLKVLKEIKLVGNSSYLEIDKKGQYLFNASYQNSSLSVSLIKKNGFLISDPVSIISNIKGCHAVLVDKKQKIIFVSSLIGNYINIYSFNKKGKLIQDLQKKINFSKKSGPRHIVIHPKIDFIYNINEISGTIDSWFFNRNINKIIHIQNVNIMPKNISTVPWSSDIQITPNGKYLYASDRNSNLISIFKINENGILKIVDYVETEKQTRSFSIDFFGNFLIVIGEKSNYIKVFKIKNTGKLKGLFRYFTGINPTWIKMINLKKTKN